MERTRERSRDEGRGGRDDGRGRGRDEGRGGRDRDDSRGGRGGRRFEYQSRNADATKKRGEQGGGDFDKYLKDDVKMFKPADGDNNIRIMPPTWDKAQHFGFDIHVHYDIGPDSQTYLCPDKMKGEPCPICDARAQAVKDGDTAYADKLKPTHRVLIYLIDRNNEKDGPMVWSMPWTIDRDLCKLVVDKRTGDTLPIDHPEDGYDIEFERKGKGDRTQYIGLQVARRESDLGNSKWLDQIVDAPLPDQLVFYQYEHVEKVFGGSSGKGRRETEAERLDREQDRDLRNLETRGDRSRGRDRDRDEDALSWDQVHDMTFDELCSIIDDKGLKINADDSKDDAELADWVCEDLKIEKAEARRQESGQRAKLDEMRSRRRVD